MLLPSWMDPEHLITAFGPYALWVVAFIIFAECGLFAILPGDSLLFTVGLFVAAGADPPPPGLRLHGADRRRRGRQRLRLLDRPADRAAAVQTAGGSDGQDLQAVATSSKTHEFFERYGNRALILARFVPIVRTFVTLVAGVGQDGLPQVHHLHRDRRRAVGLRVTIAGYYLGNIPFIKNNIDAVLILIVLDLGDPDAGGVPAAPPPRQEGRRCRLTASAPSRSPCPSLSKGDLSGKKADPLARRGAHGTSGSAHPQTVQRRPRRAG